MECWNNNLDDIVINNINYDTKEPLDPMYKYTLDFPTGDKVVLLLYDNRVEEHYRSPLKGFNLDNTNVYRPELFKTDLIKKNIIDDDDLFNIKLKRVCVQIPEQYVEDFKKSVWKFKNEKGLTNLPLGVYDIEPKK